MALRQLQALHRVLMIDPDRACHERVRRILRISDDTEKQGCAAEDFHLDTAVDDDNGVALVHDACRLSRPYALALVELSCWPAPERVRTIEALWEHDPHLEVVLCCGHDEDCREQVDRELGRAGRVTFLRKPFDGVELRQVVRTLGRKRQLELEAALRLEDMEALVSQRTRRIQEVIDELSETYEEVVALNRKLQAREDELQRLASHDGLTGLPNRAFFLQHLDLALERATRYEEYGFALLFLDLDRFKIVNDSLGHPAGDELLRQVGARLRQFTRGVDMIARLGGDEFTVLASDVRDPADARRVADRIHAALHSPFIVRGTEISVNASIGIAISEPTHVRAEDILRHADMAMYRAKDRDDSRTEIYDASQHSRALDRLALENDLRRAVREEEFVVHYQPVVDLTTLEVVGAEALARWDHPERGLLYPAAFIQAAEECGEILGLGRRVLEQACAQVATWVDADPARDFFVSVNVAARQLARPDFADEVIQILGERGLDGQRLRLEIVESMIIDLGDVVLSNLYQLRESGVRFALDDFGTGYSSLSFLQRLPADTLKIDRSFVREIVAERRSADLVRSIVSVGRTLDMNVIAEGIEHPEELRLLIDMGCHLAQGYYFSRAVPAEEFSLLYSAPPKKLPWCGLDEAGAAI